MIVTSTDDLKEVREGIYSLNGYDLGNPKPPIIAVHPYAFIYHMGEISTQIPAAYLERLEELIKNYGGPIITLEDKDDLNRTVEIYRLFGQTTDRFFIQTKELNSEPIKINWECFLTFVESFSGRPIELVGGYIRPNNGGCLMTTLNELTGVGLEAELKEGLVFHSPEE